MTGIELKQWVGMAAVASLAAMRVLGSDRLVSCDIRVGWPRRRRGGRR